MPHLIYTLAEWGWGTQCPVSRGLVTAVTDWRWLPISVMESGEGRGADAPHFLPLHARIEAGNAKAAVDEVVNVHLPNYLRRSRMRHCQDAGERRSRNTLATSESTWYLFKTAPILTSLYDLTSSYQQDYTSLFR